MKLVCHLFCSLEDIIL